MDFFEEAILDFNAINFKRLTYKPFFYLRKNMEICDTKNHLPMP